LALFGRQGFKNKVMKPYLADKNIWKKKKVFLSKSKRNLLLGITTITKSSKLEYKNAARSYKKTKRQMIKKDIKNILEEERNS